MKMRWLGVGIILLAPFTAFAGASNSSGLRSADTCLNGGASRVALRDDAAPCCDGHLQCAQMLSTQIIIQKRPRNRA